tara:strand:+ start:56 stop:514 length:459 start_codon:yes stop_codon:yes gene_type:complete
MADIRILNKYSLLSDKCCSEDGPFRELAQFFCFCANYAYITGGKIPKAKVSSKDRQVRDLVLDNLTYKEQIDILSLAVTKDHTILMETDESKNKRYEIFQDYVNFGLQLFEKKHKNKVTDTNGMETALEILIERAKNNKKIEPESELGDPNF